MLVVLGGWWGRRRDFIGAGQAAAKPVGGSPPALGLPRGGTASDHLVGSKSPSLYFSITSMGECRRVLIAARGGAKPESASSLSARWRPKISSNASKSARRRPNGAGGVEERADWEGSASVEHHSCSVSDEVECKIDVGRSRENFESYDPSMLRSDPMRRSSVEIAHTAAKSQPAAQTRMVSAARLTANSGEVVAEFQVDSSRADSPVRISHGQPNLGFRRFRRLIVCRPRRDRRGFRQ